MTLIEILIAVVILSVVVGVAGKATGMFAATVDASKDRSDRAVARAALDSRIGEVSRTAPQLGDLTVVGASAMSFRKRQAPSAAVCSYTSPTLQISMTAAELGNIRPSDSVAVRDSRGTPDPSDDTWDIGVITSNAQTGVCDSRPTVAATLTPAPAAGAVSAGATVRVWSTRTYTVQAAPAFEVGSLSGSVLIETINGINPARAFGPFVTGPVFTYLDANGNSAASAAAIRLVRATFAPIAQRQREAVALRTEHMEWPIASSAVNVAATPGDVPVVTGSANPTARCNTPGATNYGSMTDPCAFPPPVAVANVTPNPVTTGTATTFDMSGSYDAAGNAVTQYQWVIGGTSYTQPTLSLNFPPGNVCWTAQVTNARNLTSSQQSGCVTVYAVPTASASGTPNPVTVGQVVTLTCSVDGKGRPIGAYEWVIDGGNASGQTVSETASSSGSHSYQCRGQSDLGSWSAWTAQATYMVYDPPTATASASTGTQNVGQYVDLSAVGVDGKGRAIVAYAWSGSVSSTSSTVAAYCSASGTYGATLQVESDLGAWSSPSSVSWSCVNPDPPCPYGGAPSGMTQSNPSCNPYLNSWVLVAGTSSANNPDPGGSTSASCSPDISSGTSTFSCDVSLSITGGGFNYQISGSQ
ncbi:MAG: hypothetical protein ACR2M1_08695, partial [Gemmatimonadaceae bacterium]